MKSDIVVWGILGLAALFLLYVLSKRERFGVPEFLERSSQERTTRLSGSSYAQETNHFTSPDSRKPPKGQNTGHRVNLWDGHTAL